MLNWIDTFRIPPPTKETSSAETFNPGIVRSLARAIFLTSSWLFFALGFGLQIEKHHRPVVVNSVSLHVIERFHFRDLRQQHARMNRGSFVHQNPFENTVHLRADDDLFKGFKRPRGLQVGPDALRFGRPDSHIHQALRLRFVFLLAGRENKNRRQTPHRRRFCRLPAGSFPRSP